VSESGRTPAARVIDTLGHYDPMRKPKAVDLDVARTEAWIAKGARPTGSVLQMLSKERAKASSASA
jgi:ribosomal protein S16